MVRIEPCHTIAQQTVTSNATSLLTKLGPDTTVEEFDKIYPEDSMLEVGGRDAYWSTGPMHQHALLTVTSKGNLALIQHIVAARFSPHLLSLGNEYGITPLHAAQLLNDTKKAFQASRLLIQLGAKTNIGLRMEYSTADHIFPQNATPLWIATKIGNSVLVKLLLRKGASEEVTLTEEEHALVKSTKEMIAKEPDGRACSALFAKIKHLTFPEYTASMLSLIAEKKSELETHRTFVFKVSKGTCLSLIPREILDRLASFYVYVDDEH